MALTTEQLMALAKLKTASNNVTPVVTTPTGSIADALARTKQLAANISAKKLDVDNLPATVTGTSTTPMNNFALHEAIAKLSELILTAHPTLPILLRTIHKQITSDPELAIVLSEEEIGTIVNAAKLQVKTEITTGVIKAASSTKLKKKNLSVDMF